MTTGLDTTNERQRSSRRVAKSGSRRKKKKKKRGYCKQVCRVVLIVAGALGVLAHLYILLSMHTFTGQERTILSVRKPGAKYARAVLRGGIGRSDAEQSDTKVQQSSSVITNPQRSAAVPEPTLAVEKENLMIMEKGEWVSM